MSDLIHCDFKGKTWISDRKLREAALEQQMLQIVSEICPSIPYGGRGIDGMFTDTAPCEMIPYHTDDKEPA